MKAAAPRDIKPTRRFGQMTAQQSIQDFWDAVVELVTNADDSYHQLFVDGKISRDGGPILLEVEPKRKGKCSVLTVRDRAAGFKDLDRKIEQPGDKTSLSGERGFMARGLKDCAALGHVTVETIVDGVISKAEITKSFKLIPYKASRKGGDLATTEDRRRLGIKRGNGTMVRVEPEPRIQVPRLETIIRELPQHRALRDITSAESGSKVLVKVSDSASDVAQWEPPSAELVHDVETEVPGYPGRKFRFRLYRAAAYLEDPPDKRFRRSGIIIKGRRGIHDCSFLDSELERDPAAGRFFGRIECAAIDEVAEEWDERRQNDEDHPPENPLLILDPNRRGGLTDGHPFRARLYEIPIQLIKKVFEDEREKERREQRKVESKETTDRLRRLAHEASKFMRKKLEDLGAAGPGETVSKKSFHKIGVGIAPAFTQIAVGDTKTFQVYVSKKLNLSSDDEVTVGLSKAAQSSLEIIGEPTGLADDPRADDVMRASFSLRGVSVFSRAQVWCRVGSQNPVFCEVQVVSAEPEDIEISNDFAFHRQQYTVKHGGRRTLVVQGRFNGTEPPTLKVRSIDANVVKFRERTSFGPVEGTTYQEATVVIEGEKLLGKTRLIAECDGRQADCKVKVVERDEQGTDLAFELTEQSLGENYRAVWDVRGGEPNKLLITTQHESVRRYLGPREEGYPGQNNPPFRVLLAELIADNVCRRIVEAHAKAVPHEFDSDKVYLLHNRLMKEFTPIAHSIQLSAP